MKKYLKAYFSLASLLLTIHSTPCWGMERLEDYPLTLIAKRPSNSDGPRVVFDIDYTMGFPPSLTKDNVSKVEAKYPDACIIRFLHDKYNSSIYFFYPHYGEVFLTLLEWGWHVDFFSAEPKKRNEVLIPAYLKVTLKPYSQDIEGDYASLAQSQELRVFSYHHLSYEKDRRRTQYESDGADYKKDLSTVGSIKDTILVDDDRSYALGSQYPYIGLDFLKSRSFRGKILSDLLGKEEVTSPMNYAAYILGILAECKDLLDKKKEGSLRAALDVVLQDPTHANSSETPWFLWPNEKNSKITGWIEKGKALINEMRLRAKSSEVASDKPTEVTGWPISFDICCYGSII